jgi:acetylserotonin O-methyltransferase
MTPPDPAPVFEIIEGFRRSKVMFTAVRMGVFDLLADGPMTAREIASRLGANPSATERLLESCFGLGLLALEDGRFSNRSAADTYLTRKSERSLAGYIVYSDLVLYPCWAHLEDAVIEGTPRWAQTFGSERPIFDHFFRTPETMRAFTMGMHGLGLTTSPMLVRAFDLSGFHTMADLGGSTGHLVIAACEAWPNLKGIVFDMPNVLEFAAEQIAKSSARARLRTAGGDFFESELPEADLYALGRILHDWPEERILILLRRIHERLPSGGAVLIAEKLIHEDRSGPIGAHLQSLSMLVVAEGKERSFSEYAALLKEAGFVEPEGKRTGTYLDAVIARKR